MIEQLAKQIIDNLGATGLLVIGLYGVLCRPLSKIATTLESVNKQLIEIINALRD